MSRTKDWLMDLEQKMSDEQEQDLIDEQRRVDDMIENQIEEEKIKKIEKASVPDCWLKEYQDNIIYDYKEELLLGIDEDDLPKMIWLDNLCLADVPVSFIEDYYEKWCEGQREDPDAYDRYQDSKGDGFR